ncbi:MAG: CoA transferase subunit A, partial [Betaproteobacteria bacterium]|nr:CoA transferase subunit A [Betaproteobacteria bacterium]
LALVGVVALVLPLEVPHAVHHHRAVHTGVGTLVAEGKEIKQFDGEDYVLERALVPDLSLVKAHIADRAGNLMFRRTARNFNPNVAMAGRLTVVEVEQLVDTGALDPDQIHLPGIFVHRIVVNPSPEKRIEQRTTRPD